jgi:hypothetical protein
MMNGNISQLFTTIRFAPTWTRLFAVIGMNSVSLIAWITMSTRQMATCQSSTVSEVTPNCVEDLEGLDLLMRGVHHVIEVDEGRFRSLERACELLDFGIVLRVLQLHIEPGDLALQRLPLAPRLEKQHLET